MSRNLAIGLAVVFTLLAAAWLQQAHHLSYSEQSDVFQRSVNIEDGEPYADLMLSLRLRAVAALAFAGSMVAFVVLARRAEPPKLVTALAKLPAATVICGLLAAFTLMSTIYFTTALFGSRAELARQEERLLEIKRKLETFELDARGRVHPDKNMEFQLLINEAKHQPSTIEVYRDNVRIEGGAAAGSLLATVCLGLVARRSAKKAQAAGASVSSTA